MYFDRFDICEAYYIFASLYHAGEGSEEYKIFGRLHALKFKPGPMKADRDQLSENGQAIYDGLVERWTDQWQTKEAV